MAGVTGIAWVRREVALPRIEMASYSFAAMTGKGLLGNDGESARRKNGEERLTLPVRRLTILLFARVFI